MMKSIHGGAMTCRWLLSLFPMLALSAEFSVSPKVLHQFSANNQAGYNAQGGLIKGSDGAFYGTTVYGGANKNLNTLGHGTVYKLQADGSGFSVIHHFREASNPQMGVTEGRDGFLYGTTESGGNRFLGTVFKVAKDGSGFAILHHFSGIAAEGKRPYAALNVDSNAVCYGTTVEGGQYFKGTVFRIDGSGHGYRVLYHFIGKQRMDGSEPKGPLLRASDGNLYGTTSGGGRNNFGTIFTLDDNGVKYRLLHAFGDQLGDGAKPFAGLVEGSDGKLYGTTIAGGTSSQGTVFSVGKDGKGYQVLRSFPVPMGDAQNLYSPLTEGGDGALYGAALNGGTGHSGLIFRIGKDGRDYTPVWTFTLNGIEGGHPYGGLVLESNGTIYGATTSGGAERQGALFRLDRVAR